MKQYKVYMKKEKYKNNKKVVFLACLLHTTPGVNSISITLVFAVAVKSELTFKCLPHFKKIL